MFEIELKAHVKDYDFVLKKLHEISDFVHYVEKNDTYYHLSLPAEKSVIPGKNYITARIRRTMEESEEGSSEKAYLTYKKKETLKSDDQTEIEVNDEKESLLSDWTAVETLLLDSGFFTFLTKQKKVQGFGTETPLGHCNLELCTVPPLGDFLEIEILAADNSEKTVKEACSTIKNFFTECGLSEKDIETRYYSDMLKSIKN